MCFWVVPKQSELTQEIFVYIPMAEVIGFLTEDLSNPEVKENL